MFLREPLRAHPCALDVGHPWPPTFPEKHSSPQRQAIELAFSGAREKGFLGTYTRRSGRPGQEPFPKLSAAWMLPSSVQGRIYSVFREGLLPRPDSEA